MIEFGKDICGDLDASLQKEWLEINGLGGFASSSIVGLNTRRYHGLLVAATKPPVGRLVLLSKLEETLFIDGRAFELSSNRYPGTVHPHGFRLLKQFRLDPFPVFSYEIEGIEIEKCVFMIYGENSVVVQYDVTKHQETDPRGLRLEVKPLIAFRDYHGLTHENSVLDPDLQEHAGCITITPYQGLPSLYVASNAGEFAKTGDWYRSFEYEAERERGLDFTEDLFNPFVLRFDLGVGKQAEIIASTERRQAADAGGYRLTEVARRKTILQSAPINDEFVSDLCAAADQYIVARRSEKTVIAGYHWFSDWGRDTMIALPGLTLPTGRHEVARSILRTFAQHVNQGMLPNRFPDAGEAPEYNTVDATLWFFEAARAYLDYTGDLRFVLEELYPVFADIIAWHVSGTRYGIKVNGSGLLFSGEPGVQLTWMDAKVGDWVVTPRHGKPVEIQALWYNALCIMEEFARIAGDAAGQKRYSQMATIASYSFNRQFWNDQAGCLFDVMNGAQPDTSIRPNQIFAVSLKHSMLSTQRAKAVVEKVREQLLTPFGLRTLAPSDPHYRGRYSGGPVERDGAYHQGTVWPWLMGPFISAYIKVNGNSDAARQQAMDWLAPLRAHLADAGLGHISEIFDGDLPHRACGCIAQAWSVAEVLRALVEDVYDSRPGAFGQATSASQGMLAGIPKASLPSTILAGTRL